jgi:Calcineurin-like phosphoesterase
MPTRARKWHFSWLDPRILWQARRNDLIARFLSDPVNDERRRWVAAQRGRQEVPGDFIIDRSDLTSASFLVLGDTGEGDASQFALVPPLLEIGKDTQFMVICSDVVYPAGDMNEYLDKFFVLYKDYPRPIYALPGNHDW